MFGQVNKEKKVHQEKMVLTDSPDLLVSREIRVQLETLVMLVP